ncbi:hypothetical protein JX265_009479 [Neoarthrinium moseri]|uniref:Uncharacterized protein n=1 Tax=Neoarthrinium moseri TaxID=1658444 RepID=A0A9P9WG35_9PEZI|nr:hypothetical protein JX265_009479 [Neoarthrinium moseri]
MGSGLRKVITSFVLCVIDKVFSSEEGRSVLEDLPSFKMDLLRLLADELGTTPGGFSSAWLGRFYDTKGCPGTSVVNRFQDWYQNINKGWSAAATKAQSRIGPLQIGSVDCCDVLGCPDGPMYLQVPASRIQGSAVQASVWTLFVGHPLI